MKRPLHPSESGWARRRSPGRSARRRSLRGCARSRRQTRPWVRSLLTPSCAARGLPWRESTRGERSESFSVLTPDARQRRLTTAVPGVLATLGFKPSGSPGGEQTRVPLALLGGRAPRGAPPARWAVAGGAWTMRPGNAGEEHRGSEGDAGRKGALPGAEGGSQWIR